MLTISTINAVSLTIATYAPIPIFFIGVFGNIFNIIIFTRPSLIKNSCTIYLLGSSIASLGVLCNVFAQQAAANLIHYDFMAKSVVVCRLFYGLLYPCMILSSWFLVLASIDRFCITSSNVKLRSYNTLYVARRLSIITVCVAIFLYAHVYFLYDIQKTSIGYACRPRAGIYTSFFDFFYFAMYSFTPPILLAIIGVATFVQVRRVRSRMVAPATKTTTALTSNSVSRAPVHLNRKDGQLVTMLLLQLLALTILTPPHAIQKLCGIFIFNSNPNPWESAILSLLVQISRQLASVNCGISFYLYNISTTSIFHQEFIRLVKKPIMLLFHRDPRVYPTVQFVTNINTDHLNIATALETTTKQQMRPTSALPTQQ